MSGDTPITISDVGLGTIFSVVLPNGTKLFSTGLVNFNARPRPVVDR